MRLERHGWAEHSAPWLRDRRCACGAGEAADMRHVLTGRCKGMRGRDVYLARMQRLTERLVKLVPKPFATPTVATPMARWMCACRVQVLRTHEAVHILRAGGVESDEQWSALMATMAGVLPRNAGMEGIATGKRDRDKARRLVDSIVDTVKLMQEEAMAMMEGRWEVMREVREAAHAEAEWDRALWKMVDDIEEQERRAQEERAQMEREKEERVRAAAEERERRSCLRRGDEVANTRLLLKRVDEGEGTCEQGCDERWARVCVGCRWRTVSACKECVMVHGLTAGTCRRCRREVAGACAGCVEAVQRMCNACRVRMRERPDGVEHRTRQRDGDGQVGQAAGGPEAGQVSDARKQQRRQHTSQGATATVGAVQGRRHKKHVEGKRQTRCRR